MCLLGKRFSRHGSSLPEGARMLAVSWLRSLSVIFSDTSVEVPTFSCDVLIESSPVRELGRVRPVSVPEGLSPCLNLYITWCD